MAFEPTAKLDPCTCASARKLIEARGLYVQRSCERGDVSSELVLGHDFEQ